ncbi:hypothetical protein KYX90_13420, partial [Enterococcus lactis]|uniref:hypothetical protein n=1 Tax=Enterococcus lactis TaxID=357441 RepID=UPI001C7CF6BD
PVATEKKQQNDKWETETADQWNQHDQFNEQKLAELGDVYTSNEQESTGAHTDVLSESDLEQVAQRKRITDLQSELGELQG